jgi:hypothetical protein
MPRRIPVLALKRFSGIMIIRQIAQILGWERQGIARNFSYNLNVFHVFYCAIYTKRDGNLSGKLPDDNLRS